MLYFRMIEILAKMGNNRNGNTLKMKMKILQSFLLVVLF